MKKIIKVLAVSLIVGASALQAGKKHEAKGVVNAIKASQQKINISHGPIKSLGMDGMTMDFKVYDPSMLEEISKGHNIEFVVEMDKAGNMIIMEIEDKGKAKKGAMASGHGDDHHDH